MNTQEENEVPAGERALKPPPMHVHRQDGRVKTLFSSLLRVVNVIRLVK